MVVSSSRTQTSVALVSGGASNIGKAIAEKLCVLGADTNFFQNTISGYNIGYGALSPDEVAETVLFALQRPRHVSLNHLTVCPSLQPF
ncbi:hypothetical protein [Rufibacter sp. XAAS-G3-1]|uniref:hypothetical protein n=1 Tax=Rufibacter sp. XAAS-G3-1 TaxID=2729134 RepID=UPI0015E7C826|nr:hypothetical protein [Rufibacter sp. XAAS-G3-1]